MYSLNRDCSHIIDCRRNCTSGYCVSRGIHTSSDPGLHVNFPHPSALVLRCLSVSNNATYSVLAQRFEPRQKRQCESFGETSYLPDFHSNGIPQFGDGPVRQVKPPAKKPHVKHWDEPSPSVVLRDEDGTTTVRGVTHPDKADTGWRLKVIFRGAMSKFLSGVHKHSESLCGRCIIAFAIWI